MMFCGDLFPQYTTLRKARTKPRKLMHFTDVGYVDGVGQAATFKCPRCGHRSDWQAATDTQVRRGVPCPRCSQGRAIP